MINLYISGDAYLDLLILHGDEAVDRAFQVLREEFYDQVERLKASGAYEKREKELHQKLINKAT